MTAAVRREPLDVVFFPSVYTYFPVVTRARVVLGVHDVIVDQYPQLIFPDRRRLWLWQIKSWLAHRQAHSIVTVSDYAKAGILQYFHHPANRVWVVGEAADPVFRPIGDEQAIALVLNRYGLGHSSRFIICLGGLNPHKNLSVLFCSVAEIRRESQFSDLEIVLVGPAEGDTFTPGTDEARRTVEELGLAGVVHFTGYLPDEEVACLLNAARVLAMPSFDEGFGLGAVEAAACGTPVVATRNSPLPNLLDGGGWFVDPHQPRQVTQALKEALSDEPDRRQRGQRALAQAQRLTWQRAADQFNEMLDSLELAQ